MNDSNSTELASTPNDKVYIELAVLLGNGNRYPHFLWIEGNIESLFRFVVRTGNEKLVNIEPVGWNTAYSKWLELHQRFPTSAVLIINTVIFHDPSLEREHERLIEQQGEL